MSPGHFMVPEGAAHFVVSAIEDGERLPAILEAALQEEHELAHGPEVAPDVEQHLEEGSSAGKLLQMSERAAGPEG